MEKTKALTDLFTPVLIHLVLAIAGIIAYILLLRKMRREQVPDIPKISLFMFFLIYVAILIVTLAELFWRWPEMSNLGLAFLAFVAPIICSIIAWKYRNNTAISNYHCMVYSVALAYLITEAFLIVIIAVIQR